MRKIIITILILLSNLAFSQLIVLKKNNYKIIFDTIHKTTIYTKYNRRNQNQLLQLPRTSIKWDRKIKQNQQSGYKDFKKQNKYDKGHLVPIQDFQYEPLDLVDVDLYTNIIPQIISFNRGVWRTLENYIHDLPFDNNFRETIYTGCIYDGKTINSILIPKYLFKIYITKNDTVCWKIPNEINLNSNFNYYRIDKKSILQKINSYGYEN